MKSSGHGPGPTIAGCEGVPVVGADMPTTIVEPSHQLHGTRAIFFRKADVDCCPVMERWGHGRPCRCALLCGSCHYTFRECRSSQPDCVAALRPDGVRLAATAARERE